MTTFEEEKADFLEHYGTPGMRWGKRKNSNYGDQQIKRDEQVYGKRGANRINKALNKGDQISTARGNEKTRRDNVMSKNKYVRQGGKLAGGAVAAGVGFVAMRAIGKAATSTQGRAVATKLLGEHAGVVIGAANNPLVAAAVGAGAAKVGYMMAGDAAVALNMRAHGYDPNRR